MTRGVILLLLLAPGVTQAQESVQERLGALQVVPEVLSVPPGVDRIEALTAGEEAPYAGMLLGMDTAIRWTNALRWWPDAFRLRLGAVSETFAALEESYTLRLRIVEESYGREVAGLRADLLTRASEYAEALTEEFYESWGFAFVVGVLVTVVVAGLAVVGLIALR